MSEQTKAELAEENAKLKSILEELGWEDREPSLMETIEQNEADALRAIAGIILDCESETGRPLIAKDTRVVEIVQVITKEMHFVPDFEVAGPELREILESLAVRAAKGGYSWKNFSQFMSWAQPIMRSAFDRSLRQSHFE